MAKESDTKQKVQKILQTKKVVFGTDRTLKSLKNGRLASVLMASDCPVKEMFIKYCGLYNAVCEELPLHAHDLGALCKKPFAISAFGVENE